MRGPSRESLPDTPPGSEVTAWAALTGGTPLAPRAAMILLLHVSWLRWQEYAGELKAQVEAGSSRSRGLVGHKTSASAVTGGIFPTGEEIRALVRLEGQERDRCAQLAKTAHDMGLDGEW